jgi:hypothetical protein
MKKLLPILLPLILLLSACALAATQAPVQAAEPAQAQPTVASSSPALFQIIKPDGSKFDVTLDAVKTLPLAQLTVEGKVEEGPYLLDVLALAGVTKFTEITLTGSSSPATLTFEQVDKNTILDFNNHGTMKLSSTYIPKANWTKDVAEITVK